MVRVVVAVDPSGSGDEDNADNDAIGIVVAGLGTDGNAYVLEDVTVKAGPATWGRVATSAFDRHAADVVVGEVNYGGAMVQQTILVARPRTPFKAVTASRGKHVRAEPFSALYEQGKVRHAGQFRELEDELPSRRSASWATAARTGRMRSSGRWLNCSPAWSGRRRRRRHRRRSKNAAWVLSDETRFPPARPRAVAGRHGRDERTAQPHG